MRMGPRRIAAMALASFRIIFMHPLLAPEAPLPPEPHTKDGKVKHT